MAHAIIMLSKTESGMNMPVDELAKSQRDEAYNLAVQQLVPLCGLLSDANESTDVHVLVALENGTKVSIECAISPYIEVEI